MVLSSPSSMDKLLFSNLSLLVISCHSSRISPPHVTLHKAVTIPYNSLMFHQEGKSSLEAHTAFSVSSLSFLWLRLGHMITLSQSLARGKGQGACCHWVRPSPLQVWSKGKHIHNFGELVRIAGSQTHPRPTESESSLNKSPTSDQGTWNCEDPQPETNGFWVATPSVYHNLVLPHCLDRDCHLFGWLSLSLQKALQIFVC